MVSGSLRLSRANSPASVLTAHSHVPQPDRRVPRAAARAVTRSGSWCTTGLSQAPGGTRPPAPNSSGERPSTKQRSLHQRLGRAEAAAFAHGLVLVVTFLPVLGPGASRLRVSTHHDDRPSGPDLRMRPRPVTLRVGGPRPST